MATDEHQYVFEPDHASRAVRLLLRQYRWKPRFEAFICALAAGAQTAENQLYAVLIGGTTIDGAEGKSLENWGDLVGERRAGLLNEDYRTFIDLRISVNSSIPNEDNVFTLISGAVAPRLTVAFDMPPRGLQFIVRGDTYLDPVVQSHLVGLVAAYRPAGTMIPIVQVIPDHFKLDWEDGGTIIAGADGVTGNTTAVISQLAYSGRGQG